MTRETKMNGELKLTIEVNKNTLWTRKCIFWALMFTYNCKTFIFLYFYC